MAALLQARSERVKPALDDKILVSWNGLFLHAMLVAYRATRRADLLQSNPRSYQSTSGTLSCRWYPVSCMVV